MATKKFKFSKETKQALLNNAINQLRQKGQKIQEQIETFYLAEVDAFYSEYDPEVYKRHSYSDLPDSGLGRTYSPILEEKKTSQEFTYRVGIEISTTRMHDDYSVTPEQVLNSYLAGYHGLPPYEDKRTGLMHYPPMISELRPIEDTWYFIDNVLLKNIDSL